MTNSSPWPNGSVASMIRQRRSAVSQRGIDEAHHPPVEGVEGLVDAGIVDEDDLALVRRLDAQDADPRRLRLVRDDGDLLTQEGVEEGGLADVGPSEEGDVSDPEERVSVASRPRLSAFRTGAFFVGGFRAAVFRAAVFRAGFCGRLLWLGLGRPPFLGFRSVFISSRPSFDPSCSFLDPDLLDPFLVDVEDLEA